MRNYFKIIEIKKIQQCQQCGSIEEVVLVKFRLPDVDPCKGAFKLCENCLKEMFKYCVEEFNG